MPFRTIQQVSLAWRAIADQHRHAGNREKALQVLEDLHEYLRTERSLEVLKRRYYEHLRQAETFSSPSKDH